MRGFRGRESGGGRVLQSVVAVYMCVFWRL